MNYVQILLRTCKAYIVAMQGQDIDEDPDSNSISFRVGDSIYSIKVKHKRIKTKEPMEKEFIDGKIVYMKKQAL